MAHWVHRAVFWHFKKKKKEFERKIYMFMLPLFMMLAKEVQFPPNYIITGASKSNGREAACIVSIAHLV